MVRMLIIRRVSRREEHGVVERLRAVGLLLLTGRVMQEHQIQVGAVTQLQATELAVGDDGKARRARRRRSRRSEAPRGGRPAPARRCASAASSTSSAMSVSRSLTFISGSDPARSTIATRNIAAC